MRRSRPLTRGYALLMVLALIGITYMLVVSLFHCMYSHRQLSRKAEATARAREASRAGLEMALSELRRNGAWREGFQDLQLAPQALVTLSFQGLPRDLLSVPNPGTEPLLDPDGRLLPPHCIHLVSSSRCFQAESVSEALVALNVTLLENDFNFGAAEWQQNFGIALAALGFYVLDLDLQRTALAGDESWSDYEASFRALIPQGTGIGFLVRVSGTPNQPTGYLMDYQLLDQLLRGGTFHIYKLEEGRSRLLASVARQDTDLRVGSGWLLGLAHDYVARAQGGDLSFSVDGVTVLKVTDPDPIRQGRVGIQPLLGTLALVDRVQVQSLFQVLAQWRR